MLLLAHSCSVQGQFAVDKYIDTVGLTAQYTTQLLAPKACPLTRAASRASLILTLSLLRKSARLVIAARRLPLARYSVTNAGGLIWLTAISWRCLQVNREAATVVVGGLSVAALPFARYSVTNADLAQCNLLVVPVKDSKQGWRCHVAAAFRTA
jgi:hypothetical protein